MRNYKINYAEVNSYSLEEFLITLECVCRYANFAEYPSVQDVLAILGIVPFGEETKQMTQDDVEEILFGEKTEDGRN